MPPILAAFSEYSGPDFWMSGAGLALLVIGCEKRYSPQALGLDRIVSPYQLVLCHHR
jgi:hypothetical protein